MYFLYADDSGIASDKSCKHSALAGFVTSEIQTFWIQKVIDEIMMRHTGRADLELHASPIRSGKGVWRTFTKEKREAILTDILEYIKEHYPNQFILFGAVAKNSSTDVSENLFLQLTSRFDNFLKRKFLKRKEQARGLAIFDKSKSELQYQNWSKIYQNKDNPQGKFIHNFAEVPLFLDSSMSRNIQVADLIAYSLFRKFEYGDEKYFSIIEDCFDKKKKTQCGLYVEM